MLIIRLSGATNFDMELDMTVDIWSDPPESSLHGGEVTFHSAFLGREMVH